jgi:dTDP-4-amino-4,6-dideoxygalactose transaminase
MNTRPNIPFSPPDITQKEIDGVVETMKSGWITTGPKTKQFEREIAEYVGTPRAVCLSSSTAAMEMTLRTLGIGPGDEVILPAYTYTATCSIICHVGATPVMVDIDGETLEMDYDQMESKITEKTKVIIPVDIAGILCDYSRIYDIVNAKKHLFRPSSTNPIQQLFGRIIVMADSAHGFGAMRDGLRSGYQADFTCFSFHAVKNLTTAEGGAVTWPSIEIMTSSEDAVTPHTSNSMHSSFSCIGTNGSASTGFALPDIAIGTAPEDLTDDDIYRHFMNLSLHGQTKDALTKNKLGAWEYDIIYPAYKCNMTDIQASIGLAQLERYGCMLARRHHIIDRYDEALKPLDIKVLNHKDRKHYSSGHLYMIRPEGIGETERNEIIVKLAERGIATNVHYKPLPLLTAYKNMGFNIADYPKAYHYYQGEITLPLYSKLTDEEVEYVAETVVEILEEYI